MKEFEVSGFKVTIDEAEPMPIDFSKYESINQVASAFPADLATVIKEDCGVCGTPLNIPANVVWGQRIVCKKCKTAYYIG